MPAPAPLSFVTAAARKVVSALRAGFPVHPADVTPAPGQQHAARGQRREELEGPRAVSQSGHVTNQMSGTAHKVLQAGDIRGGVKF